MGLTIGVDVGGTKIAAGVVDADGTIVDRIGCDTPATVDGATAGSSTRSPSCWQAGQRQVDGGRGGGRRVRRRAPVDGAVRAEPAPGATTRCGTGLTERLGLPVVVENDANAAAWGEFRFGAGAATSTTWCCVTVGTGLGGGIVLRRRAAARRLRDRRRARAHAGGARRAPLRLRQPRLLGAVRLRARAGARRPRRWRRADPQAAARCWSCAAGSPDRPCDGPMVTEAAPAGDPAAVELLDDLGRWLGEGIASIATRARPGHGRDRRRRRARPATCCWSRPGPPSSSSSPAAATGRT